MKYKIKNITYFEKKKKRKSKNKKTTQKEREQQTKKTEKNAPRRGAKQPMGRAPPKGCPKPSTTPGASLQGEIHGVQRPSRAREGNPDPRSLQKVLLVAPPAPPA